MSKLQKQKDLVADILLINPWYPQQRENIWAIIRPCYPSLGLACIAGVLEKNNFAVAILDAYAEDMNFKDLRRKLCSIKNPPAYIGITSTTPVINYALKTAKICKEIFPNTKIVFGGVHPTVLPEETLSNTFVDYVIRNEGEYAFLELISKTPEDTILGLSYKHNGKIAHNPKRPFVENLDELPFIPVHLLPMKKYTPAIGSYKQLPAFGLVATRGCPGRCTFCYQNFGSKIRYHSARRLVDQINILKQRFGIKEISFYDDTFTAVRGNVIEFCKILKNEKINITWSCFSRVDFVDYELLAEMHSAGCHQIMYGVESADETVLRNMSKYIPFSKTEKAIKDTKKAKIKCRLAFMFGSPGETEKTLEKTLKYAIKLNPEYAVFNITTPFPGTNMFNMAKDKGYLRTCDWREYDLSTPVMDLPTVDSKFLRNFYRGSYRKFYLRRDYICRVLLGINTINDIKTLWRFIYKWLLTNIPLNLFKNIFIVYL